MNGCDGEQNETTYVYDFLELFKEALKDIWREYGLACRKAVIAAGGNGKVPDVPKVLLEAWELVPDAAVPEGVREVANNPMGHNTIGMVGWRLRLYTPECPAGRNVIVIANDITHQVCNR
jgi:hypothetical protein